MHKCILLAKILYARVVNKCVDQNRRQAYAVRVRAHGMHSICTRTAPNTQYVLSVLMTSIIVCLGEHSYFFFNTVLPARQRRKYTFSLLLLTESVCVCVCVFPFSNSYSSVQIVLMVLRLTTNQVFASFWPTKKNAFTFSVWILFRS